MIVPGWVRALLLLRGPLASLLDRRGRREVPAIEQQMLAAIEREGAAAASAPVGAGGAADSEARASRHAAAR